MLWYFVFFLIANFHRKYKRIVKTVTFQDGVYFLSLISRTLILTFLHEGKIQSENSTVTHHRNITQTTLFLILFVAGCTGVSLSYCRLFTAKKNRSIKRFISLNRIRIIIFFLSTGRHQNVSLSMSAEFRRNEYWRRRHWWMEVYRIANSYSFFEKMVIIVIEIRTGRIYISGLINYLSYVCILFDDLLFNYIHLSSKRLTRKNLQV